DGRGCLVSTAPVIGQLGRSAHAVGGGAILERFSDATVQSATPGQAQPLIEGVLGEGVREAELVGAIGGEQVGRRGLLEDIQQVVLVGVEHAGEQAEIE